MGINIDEPGNVVWRETKNHRKNNSKLTKEWTDLMRAKPTKKQVLKKETNLKRNILGIKEIDQIVKAE
jgi:hypothetical protein